MKTGKKLKNVEVLTIKPEHADEFFRDHDGEWQRGNMVAFDREGNEVARGSNYADFLAKLRGSEKLTQPS